MAPNGFWNVHCNSLYRYSHTKIESRGHLFTPSDFSRGKPGFHWSRAGYRRGGTCLWHFVTTIWRNCWTFCSSDWSLLYRRKTHRIRERQKYIRESPAHTEPMYCRWFLQSQGYLLLMPAYETLSTRNSQLLENSSLHNVSLKWALLASYSITKAVGQSLFASLFCDVFSWCNLNSLNCVVG